MMITDFLILLPIAWVFTSNRTRKRLIELWGALVVIGLFTGYRYVPFSFLPTELILFIFIAILICSDERLQHGSLSLLHGARHKIMKIHQHRYQRWRTWYAKHEDNSSYNSEIPNPQKMEKLRSIIEKLEQRMENLEIILDNRLNTNCVPNNESKETQK